MRNRLVMAAAAAACVLTVAGQAVAQQGGVRAEGWEARLDSGGDASAALSFMSMGSGVHAQTGGRGGAIFWRAGDTAGGTYTISASFTQMEPSNHPNAYGLFFGGSDLSASTLQYSYFVIRENGQYLIRNRMGGDTPIVVDWTGHDAINELNAQGSATNTLAVEVGADQIRFLVNGTEVNAQPRADFETDGLSGIRINHFLNVHVDDLQLGSM